jgi:hypothetical protein
VKTVIGKEVNAMSETGLSPNVRFKPEEGTEASTTGLAISGWKGRSGLFPA